MRGLGIAVAGVGLIGLLAACARLQAPSPKSQARVLLELSGLSRSLRSLDETATEHLRLQLGEGSPAESVELARLVGEAIDPPSIEKRVVDEIVASFDAGKADRVIQWYGSETGVKLRAAGESMATPEGQAALTDWALVLRAYPPQTKRVDLSTRLDRATGATERLSSLFASVSVALSRGLADASRRRGSEAPAPSEGEMAQLMSGLRDELRPRIREQVLLVLLYVTRELSDSQLEDYVGKAETDAAQWFSSTSFRGLEAGLSQSAARLAASLGPWLQGGAEPTQLDATIKEGERFGLTGTAQSCVEATLERDGACKTVACHVEANAFLAGCMETSPSMLDFCSEVPDPSNVLATLQWTSAVCQQRQRPDSFCTQILRLAQEHCQRAGEPKAERSIRGDSSRG